MHHYLSISLDMSVAVAEAEPTHSVLADTTNSLPTTLEHDEVVDLATIKEALLETHAVDEPASADEDAAPQAEDVKAEADESALSAELVALVNGEQDAVHEVVEVRVVLPILRAYAAHTSPLAVLTGHRRRRAKDRCRACCG